MANKWNIFNYLRKDNRAKKEVEKQIKKEMADANSEEVKAESNNYLNKLYILDTYSAEQTVKALDVKNNLTEIANIIDNDQLGYTASYQTRYLKEARSLIAQEINTVNQFENNNKNFRTKTNGLWESINNKNPHIAAWKQSGLNISALQSDSRPIYLNQNEKIAIDKLWKDYNTNNNVNNLPNENPELFKKQYAILMSKEAISNAEKNIQINKDLIPHLTKKEVIDGAHIYIKENEAIKNEAAKRISILKGQGRKSPKPIEGILKESKEDLMRTERFKEWNNVAVNEIINNPDYRVTPQPAVDNNNSYFPPRGDSLNYTAKLQRNKVKNEGPARDTNHRMAGQMQ